MLPLYDRVPVPDVMLFKQAMGVLSIAIMLLAYAIYIWQTARAEGVRPHPFSWFLWGLVTGVAYLIQRAQGGGAGSWVVGLTAIVCLGIGGLSVLKHRWHFHLLDWMYLVAGFIVFGYYLVSKNPTQAAILATATDVIGYGSTIRKGWAEPDKDSATSFALNSAKFVPALFALESYSLATWLYPATLVVVNGFVAVMLVWRRQQFAARSR
jgi:hypothetical protein